MTDAVWIFYLSAAITGGAFGYVIQRGGFCLMRALSNLYLMGDATIVRAYALALLVAMVGVQALSAAGLVDIPVRPFHWMSNITGGLVFGAGMVLAGGCSGSTWYRVGEGAVGAWIILLGFALGASTVRLGVLGPLRATLQAPTIGEVPPTLATVLGISPWLVILALWIAGGFWLFRPRPASHPGKLWGQGTGPPVGGLPPRGRGGARFGSLARAPRLPVANGRGR